LKYYKRFLFNKASCHIEKNFMLNLMRRYSALYLVEIFRFYILGNHFHILVKTLPEYKSLDQDIKCAMWAFMAMNAYLQMR
jgi:REP element-mobilizing transposase RayT